MATLFVLDKLMMRRNLLILTLFSAIAISIFAIYFSSRRGDLDIVMPLDDVYIHFQYARQLALGQPYIYNTGGDPTSGATSFIYPYVLAIGYLLGFQGLNLGIWAMLVGGGALIGVMWAIYRLCFVFESPFWLAILMPILFALTGSVSWHAMSGMETMLMGCFVLWTLLAFIEKRLNLFIICAVFLTLTRPEGSVMGGIAVVIFAIRLWLEKSTPFQIKQIILLLLPLLAISVQPALNYMLTGSFSASGSQAKSILGLIPKDWDIILARIIENIVRFWGELFTGYSPSQDLWYVIPLTIPLGIIGLILLLRRWQYRWVVLLLLLWFGAVSGAISTLDTAFWHFKRYQMPLMALFLPLSIIPLVGLLKQFPKSRWITYSLTGILVPLFVMMTFQSFLDVYQLNVTYVRQQPYAMAKWLAENTSEDALIAIHDVGMMRYVGERNTLDIVGLTTPDAAQYWRNGVGSVAEFLMEHQPDYIASYGRGHGYGLYMLADTRIYGKPLAEFKVELDTQKNVALAADTQAIYQPNWEAVLSVNEPRDVLFDLNVAHIGSEKDANYHWENIITPLGFATLVYDFDMLGCNTSHSQICNLIEGVRQFTGQETFSFNISDIDISNGLILTSRVHPQYAISLGIFLNDTLIDTQWIPENPGHWLDIQTHIPADVIQDTSTVRIVPQLDDGEVYMPAHHWLTTAPSNSPPQPDNTMANYQGNHLLLTNFDVVQSAQKLQLILNWYSDGQTTGDYRFFVHLYNDINEPPPVQWDNYLGDSTLPLGNWLEGTRQDTINLNIDALSAGEYQLMIGFYDSATYDRLIPLSDSNDVTIFDDGRLSLQSVEIK